MPLSGNKSGLVAISWKGLPQYAARLIKAAIDAIDKECVVIGSKPSVPIQGMEEVLQQKVIWIEAEQPTSWSKLGLPIPDVYLQSGWRWPAFTALGKEVKAAGGRVVGLSDANWRGNFRQLCLGPVAFRLFHRNHFDAMIVPGKQGAKLMRYLGMPANAVRQGMYGADPSLFDRGMPSKDRPKNFLYVGQFIARKNILGLAAAFLQFAETHPGWTLRLCGSGPQRDLIPIDERIIVEDFVQPEQLVARFHSCRFFVLPSLVEAWGLVVHEAAACGCGLILSDAVGSGDDLASPANALRFQAGDTDAMTKALTAAAHFTDEQLDRAGARSHELAQHFGPTRFSSEIAALMEKFDQT